ncbi:hypothetical protein ZIOFF_014712 [Zingiber officinale]|uniref:Uncharacterized protein n=1 Tax=Zingiber officinale TaxID=94328 RepID=A0A8J5LEH5_ZINOF|nr:hypothetical protein ZIOFF_014712 [Zingiber officinale]
MLSVCSNACSIRFGRAVHDLAVKLESSLAYVRNSLIDMYCKCGCLEEAAKGQGAAVHSLTVKIVCAQNQCDGSSLITMYAKCACSHNEFVDQGFKYYASMVDFAWMSWPLG